MTIFASIYYPYLIIINSCMHMYFLNKVGWFIFLDKFWILAWYFRTEGVYTTARRSCRRSPFKGALQSGASAQPHGFVSKWMRTRLILLWWHPVVVLLVLPCWLAMARTELNRTELVSTKMQDLRLKNRDLNLLTMWRLQNWTSANNSALGGNLGK